VAAHVACTADTTFRVHSTPGHQKWVETSKPRRIHGTRGDIRVSSAQLVACAVGSDSIWEMSAKVFVSVVSVTVSLIEQVTDVL
jgi:hypothetical protein